MKVNHYTLKKKKKNIFYINNVWIHEILYLQPGDVSILRSKNLSLSSARATSLPAREVHFWYATCM